MATVRPDEPADLERLVELFLELADYGIANGERRPLRWDVDPTGFARARFSHALGHPTEHRVAVAVDENGDVIGTCHTELMGEEHSCAAHVHTLVIDAPFRGRGLGRALMDDAFAWCAEQGGVDEVSLDTGVRNTRGRRFYERYGFEEATVLLIKKVDG